MSTSNTQPKPKLWSLSLSPTARPEGELTLGTLPQETQQQIVGYLPRSALLNFQRVSLHCFSLANAEIYRDIDLTITSFHSDENSVSSTHAAETLQTILASEYDYGSHIKTFRLGMVEDGAEPVLTSNSRGATPVSMSRILWDMKSDSSRILNTALLLMLRKATILETFQWDAPIELSGAVYQTLHKINSLKHLRIRLDVWPSPTFGGVPINPSQALSAGMAPTQSTASLITNVSLGSSSTIASLPATKKNAKRKKGEDSGGCRYWANPRGFSGFRYLSTLVLMGLSNLECLHEISECIKASSATLKTLTVSLSMELARKAQKPVAINPELDELSDTELEEDDMLDDLPPGPGPIASTGSPTDEADIRKEKLAQESILVRLFDLQSVASEGKKIEKHISLSEASVNPGIPDEILEKKVKDMMKIIMQLPEVSDINPASHEIRLEYFQMVRKIADLFITNHQKQSSTSKNHNKAATSSTKKSGVKPKLINSLASDFLASGSHTNAHMPSALDASALVTQTTPFSPANGGFSMDQVASLISKNGSASGTSGPTLHTFPISSSKSGKNKTSQTPAIDMDNMMDQIVDQKLKHQQKLWMKAHKDQLLSLGQAHASSHSASSKMTPLMFSTPGTLSSPPGIPDSQTQYQPWPPNSGDSSATTQDDVPLGNALLESISVDPKGPVSKTESELAKKAKSKLDTLKTPKAAPGFEVGHQTDSSSNIDQAKPSNFFAGKSANTSLEDNMDIDIEHPDVEYQDLGEDQETDSASEEIDTATPRKRAKMATEGADDTTKDNGRSLADVRNASIEAETSDDAVQAYIRATHGLQLESFSLEWVPLKASIVARALDLSVLRRITLLEVGSQDAFWMLLARLQSPIADIAFRSIHTDNASFAFLKFLATFEGLEELFIHERGSKQEVQDTSICPKTLDIRKLGLKSHMWTLKRLMIKNDRNDSWDIDIKTLQFLAYKGTALKELAISLNMKTYHVLMQYFAAFKTLYALHLINLRTGDRQHIPQYHYSENLNFAIDSLSHCPEMKLQYIAIGNSVILLTSRPEQFTSQQASLMGKRTDKKGKGKAPADHIGLLLEQSDESTSDDAEEALASVMAGESKLRIATKFGAVQDVKIFTRQIRTGKL